MGRRAGVSAQETRAKLLDAAARLFAERGYDGAGIADIARTAGLSSGAIYAHFSSKAELFTTVLELAGEREISELVGDEPVEDIAEFFRIVGSSYDRRASDDVDLAVAAIVASRRDPEVSRRVGDWLVRDEIFLATAVSDAQTHGRIDPRISADAVARFTTMLSLGAQLTGALDLPEVDHGHWADLIARLVESARTGDRTGDRTDEPQGGPT